MALSEIVLRLPHLNAGLNLLATFLLLGGYVQIRRGHERAHKLCMLAAFVTSVLFLGSYLTYHYHVPSKKFPLAAPDHIRFLYYGILLSHVILAIFVPFLAITAIFHGLRNNRSAHRKVVRFAFPIWMYVSVTGVVVYLMLYQIYG
jgi:putative membrane protein